MTAPETYTRLAARGIRLAAEPDSEIYPFQSAGSIARTYNLMLDHAAEHEDLEAVVLLHQDAEIVDPGFCAKARRALSDPEVAVVGCVGATGATGVAWWEGRVSGGPAVYRYGDWGGGDMPAVALGGDPEAVEQVGEVDTLHGFAMVLSPWAARTLRFDEALGSLHAHDFDFCRQVRAAGRKVVTADLAVAHHHSLDLVTDDGPWMAAQVRAAEKWDPELGEADDDAWIARARRAEAEAALSRLLGESRRLQLEAAAARQRERLEAVTSSSSWRITEPLRRLNRRRRRARA